MKNELKIHGIGFLYWYAAAVTITGDIMLKAYWHFAGVLAVFISHL